MQSSLKTNLAHLSESVVDALTAYRATARMFNLCNSTALEGESARVQFAGDGVISLPIQENDPACGMPMCNIAAICAAMTDNSLGSTVGIGALVSI